MNLRCIAIFAILFILISACGAESDPDPGISAEGDGPVAQQQHPVFDQTHQDSEFGALVPLAENMRVELVAYLSRVKALYDNDQQQEFVEAFIPMAVGHPNAPDNIFEATFTVASERWNGFFHSVLSERAYWFYSDLLDTPLIWIPEQPRVYYQFDVHGGSWAYARLLEATPPVVPE